MLDAATVGGTGGSDSLSLVMGEMSSRTEAKADGSSPSSFLASLLFVAVDFVVTPRVALGVWQRL